MHRVCRESKTKQQGSNTLLFLLPLQRNSVMLH